MTAVPPDVPGTIAEVLARARAAQPEREALVTRHARMSYRELDEAAERGAHVLWDLGVRPGDRVAASLPNDTDVVVTFHAVTRLGAVWVGVNQVLAPPEKAYILGDCGATALLCSPAVAAELAELADGPARPPALARVIPIDPADDGCEWHLACAAAPSTPVGVPVRPDAPAGIAYTSGTTGFPKGVVHSHHNLIVPGAALVALRGWGPDLRKGDSFALTILNLQVLTTLLTAQAGGCAVIMDRSDARGIAEWIERERVTVWNGAPATLHTLATDAAIPDAALGSLVEVVAGGADLPLSIRRAFTGRYAASLVAAYGLTEAPTVVTIEAPGRDDPPSNGPPLPHLALRIVDDAGHDVEAGGAGEILVGPTDRGPWAGVYTPMLGYWGRPEATAEAVVDGWLRTGDIGELDDQGHLLVRDRKNVMIIRGGANVYPAEVERVLVALPGVRGAVVVGVPDERLGERVVALLEADPGEVAPPEDLRARCLAELARYKVPDRFVFVDALPRNAMHKVDRKALTPLLEAAGGAAAT